MDDTEKAVLNRWHGALDALSPEERVKMACSMFEFSRELVTESIRNESAETSDAEINRRVFIRFYGGDFDPETLERIWTYLNSVAFRRNAPEFILHFVKDLNS